MSRDLVQFVDRLLDKYLFSSVEIALQEKILDRTIHPLHHNEATMKAKLLILDTMTIDLRNWIVLREEFEYLDLLLEGLSRHRLLIGELLMREGSSSILLTCPKLSGDQPKSTHERSLSLSLSRILVEIDAG